MVNNELKQVQKGINEMANDYLENMKNFNRMKQEFFERAVKTQLHMFNDLFAISTKAFDLFSHAKKIEDITSINEQLLKESINESGKITKEVLDNVMQASTDMNKQVELKIPKPTATKRTKAKPKSKDSDKA